jgi:hypothetical protein
VGFRATTRLLKAIDRECRELGVSRSFLLKSVCLQRYRLGKSLMVVRRRIKPFREKDGSHA